MLVEVMTDRQKEEYKAKLLESCEQVCSALGLDASALAVDKALTFGKMALEMTDVESELQRQVSTALEVIKLKMYVQLTFSFLYECELEEEEIPF